MPESKGLHYPKIEEIQKKWSNTGTYIAIVTLRPQPVDFIRRMTWIGVIADMHACQHASSLCSSI